MIYRQKSSPAGKMLLSFGFIIVSAIYAVLGKSAVTQNTTPQPMMGGMMNRMRGLYTDGSYTGSPIDAYYGIVQVKAIIQNGRITNVQFLQYPNTRSNSREINSQAMPLLTQEAITAQSARVNGVSGATFTSDAFRQSLAGALALAKN